MGLILRRVVLPAFCVSAVAAAGVMIGMNLAKVGGGPRFYYGQLADVDAPQSSILTPLHYQTSGWRRLQSFLDHSHRWGDVLRAAYDRVRPACVRVQITIVSGDDGRRTTGASGVLVGGGRYVLTAGHTLEGHDRRDAEVTLVSGYTVGAHFVEWDYAVFGDANHDWALLEIESPDDFTAPSVKLGTPTEGDLALIVGYPDLIGISSGGDIAYNDGPTNGLLEPLASCGEITGVSPLVMRPRAGAVPVGGMSGSPVVNSRGELIGVFVSVARSEYNSYTVYTYNAASVEVLRRVLARNDETHSNETSTHESGRSGDPHSADPHDDTPR